jgi:hypothetical protein
MSSWLTTEEGGKLDAMSVSLSQRDVSEAAEIGENGEELELGGARWSVP